MKKTINIEGMVCGNCVMHVKNALMAVAFQYFGGWIL